MPDLGSGLAGWGRDAWEAAISGCGWLGGGRQGGGREGRGLGVVHASGLRIGRRLGTRRAARQLEAEEDRGRELKCGSPASSRVAVTRQCERLEEGQALTGCECTATRYSWSCLHVLRHRLSF